MPNDTALLCFPNSGLTINRAKKRAKEAVKAGLHQTLTDAQNAIAHKEMGLPWAKAIDKLKSASLFMTRNDIQMVMKDIPELTHFGFGAYRDRGTTYIEHLKKIEYNKQALLNALDECNRACMYLQHLEKRKTINRNSSSYGLKHEVEYYLQKVESVDNPYVANGSFICAAHFMGFTVKRLSSDKPNACINYSKTSPIIKWKKLSKGTMTFTAKSNPIRELDELEKRLGLPMSERVKDSQHLLIV